MLTWQTADTTGRTGRKVLCLLLFSFILFFSVPSLAEEPAGAASVQTQDNAAEAARQIAAFIEHGQWDDAVSLLGQQDIASQKSFAQLQHILDEHQTLEKKRTDEQQRIFVERNEKLNDTYGRLAENDPNVTDQDALAQSLDAWKDATEAQRRELAAQPPFKVLMDQAREHAQTYYTQGQWSKAYTTGVRWLLTFDPQNPDNRQWEKKINEVNAVLEFLKKDPCEDKQARYTSIQRKAVEQVFLILQANYVKPLDFTKMGSGMLERCDVLADVLKTPPADLVVQADPNGVMLWAEQIQQCRKEGAPLQSTIENMQGLEDLLDALLALNEKTIKLPEGFLLSMLTEAALAETDPYTTVVWPYAVKNFDKAMTGQFGGVGIHIDKEKEGFRVVSLIADTPAMKAGLKADALIVAVDGESTKDMSASCAVQKISGPVGTSVTLTIRYPDADADQLLTVMRDKIVLPAVEGSRQADTGKAEGRWDYFLDENDHIGYLSLRNFTEQTIPQVNAALKKMEDQGLAGLILDIRGNGGGLLTAAVEVSDLFVDGDVLLKSQGRDNKVNQWSAKNDSAGRTYPLAILIDGASASASEIVAGILSTPSNKRAILIGSRSYGKGSVQEIVNLGDGSGKLKYTAAYYYLPDGSPVKNREMVEQAGRDDWGIAPDITVPLYDFERQQMQKVNSKRTKISNTTSEQKDEQESIRQELLSADPQLATALLVLKAEIAVR